MDKIKAGRPALDLIKLCYESDVPLLIEGKHGIGKSELLEQGAHEMGIDFICRDLSLMEPPDLIGMPKLSGKTTIFLPPDFLPTKGKGLLVFEELNRCERYMRAPCLQLLTSRTLNDYRLPKGWLPVAAVNPFDGDYETSEMDPALLSRFVQVQLELDRKEWLKWAKKNNVHSGVIAYVECDESVFDHPVSNPRSWNYVSKLLLSSERDDKPDSCLRSAIFGIVGDKRGVSFLKFLETKYRPVTAEQILSSYPRHRSKVRDWTKNGRLDLLDSSLRSIFLFLQPKADYTSTKSNATAWKNLGNFLSDLPGDKLEEAKRFFTSRKYENPFQQKRKAK